jgi:hypothetical protein
MTKDVLDCLDKIELVAHEMLATSAAGSESQSPE